jgi:phosphoribosylanthranilate isomerase
VTLVKICGVSEPRHARAAASCGADFVGVVFAPSHRQVTMGQAARIADALGRRPDPPADASVESVESRLGYGKPLLVGVFADQDVDTINAIAEEVGLDLIQLSGSEPWDVCALLARPVLKCLKVHPGQSASQVLVEVRAGALLLLDPYVEGSYGGAGVTLDWEVAGAVAKERRVMLAGGLRPENVGLAVQAVHPWAVDVSSGVETEGVKDTAKIREFIKAAKRAG